MILAIDIGNTNIKVGLFSQDELVHARRFSVTFRTADEIGAELRMLLMNEIDDISRITGIIMSSVQPDLNYTMEQACQYYFGFKPISVGVGIKTGLKIKYTNPQDVGAERIVN